MGHWGTCLIDFQLFNFWESLHKFRAAQTLTFDFMCTVAYPIKIYRSCKGKKGRPKVNNNLL